MIGFLLVLALVPAAPGQCVLTSEDKAANAKLSWVDFDQKGTLPSTGRELMERGCYQAAVDAWADYMINGPVANPREQRSRTRTAAPRASPPRAPGRDAAR